MRAVIPTVWVDINEPLEGIVLSMYADRRSLVTTGMGNLLSTARQAALLPFRRPDGSLATGAEKEAEWHDILAGCCKSKGVPGDPQAWERCAWPGKVNPKTGRGCFAHQGWRVSDAAKPRLRLTRADVDALVGHELRRMWGELIKFFPDAHTWPAAAQLALLKMSWALGPAFCKTWPKFTAAALKRDFLECARHCTMKGGGTIVQRNAINVSLFTEAHHVEHLGLDPDVLHYPKPVACTICHRPV